MEFPGWKTKTFFSTPGNANSFFDWPLEFPQYNFSIYPQEISGLQPSLSVWNFFWSSSNCHASIIVIWLFGWNSPVHYWSIPERLQTGKGVRGVGGRGVGIFLWNPPLEILDLSHYLSKFWRKQAFEIGNFMVKNQDPRKFHISFSLKPPEIPLTS